MYSISYIYIILYIFYIIYYILYICIQFIIMSRSWIVCRTLV